MYVQNFSSSAQKLWLYIPEKRITEIYIQTEEWIRTWPAAPLRPAPPPTFRAIFSGTFGVLQKKKMFVRLPNLEPTLAKTLIDERSKIENNQGSSHFIVDPAGAPLRFFRSSKFDDRKSNPNNRFKKTQRGFETILQGSPFDDPLRLQPIFSKVMG